jgi:hypothetical protein
MSTPPASWDPPSHPGATTAYNAATREGNLARVRFPPPPSQGFQLDCDFGLNHRRIRRRLCVPGVRRPIERSAELVELHAHRVARELLLEVEQRGRDNGAPAVDDPHLQEPETVLKLSALGSAAPGPQRFSRSSQVKHEPVRESHALSSEDVPVRDDELARPSAFGDKASISKVNKLGANRVRAQYQATRTPRSAALASPERIKDTIQTGRVRFGSPMTQPSIVPSRG